MKTSALLVTILAACQIEPPHKPEKALDPGDAKSLAGHAIYNTRTQKGYRTKFKARLAAPGSDALDYEGTGAWITPGVLYIQYSGSGGREQKIVRAGERAIWVHHAIAGWVTADEVGDSGAGRGMQNPDEILALLARHLGTARLRAGDVVEVPFTGADIEKIMKEQTQKGAFDWAKSEASIELHVDAETRLKKLACRASLVSADPNVPGRVTYSAEVEVADYGAAAEMKFVDDTRKEIPLTAAMRKAVEETLKEKK